MNKLRLIGLVVACLMFGVSHARAGERITVIVTITNAPLGNTNTFTLNASTRTWTNDIASSPGTLILQTNSVAYSTTNFLNHITQYPFSQGHILSQTLSNNVRIGGLVDQAMTASIVGNWATLSYSTQQVTTPTFTVRVPVTVEAATNQTNIASLLVNALNLSTNALGTNSTSGANFLTKGAAVEGTQTVTGQVNFWKLEGTNVATLYAGKYHAPTNINPINTNLINYGNALRSEGLGGRSLQLGSNALAHGARNIALGADAFATNNDAIAIGTSAIATNTSTLALGNAARAAGTSSTALGNGALASTNGATAIGNTASALAYRATAVGWFANASVEDSLALGSAASAENTNAIAIGINAEVTAQNSIALGKDSFVTHRDSVAIGNQATSTATNQIVLGTATEVISIPGRVDAMLSTNTHLKGTNKITGDLSFVRFAITSVAAGNNRINVGTNVFVSVTGTPGAAWTLTGIEGGNRDGKLLLLYNNTGFNLTVAHQSGSEATAANRIISLTGADQTSTTDSAAGLIYDESQSRWVMLWFSP